MMRSHLGVRAAAAAVAFAGVSGFSGQALADACGTTVGNATDGLVFNITADTVWGGVAKPGPICLEEPIYVGDPTVPDPAVLTILPGTIVRGQPRRGGTGTVNNNAGSLVVTQDSQLIAQGTPTSPIVLTTAAVDNDNDGNCDNLDRGLGNTFKDPFPGLNPNSPAGCAATETCNTACVAPGCTPLFCDDTPDSAPLAPLDAAGESNVQLWGGLAISGNAPTNLGDDEGVGFGKGVLEGVAVPATPIALATYGGNEPHDSSGVLEYVSVRHAGDPLIANNELNGIGFAGVGDGTVTQYLEVYTNWDDCFEWFGGTVNANHLVGLYCGDDQFDLDEGYTGTLQFLLTAMPFFNQDSGAAYGSASGDRMGEWDMINAANVNLRRDDDATTDLNTPWPFGNPFIWNLTGIGSTTDAANPATSPAAANQGLFMTAAFAGQVYNSIMVNTGANTSVSCDAAGGIGTATCVNHATADLVRLVASCSFDTGAPNATVAANGDAYAERITGNATAFDNASGTSEVLVAENAAGFGGKGGADGKLPTGSVTAFDPRPTGDCLLQGLEPNGPSVDRAASYRGAFEPGAPILWTTGWTAGNAAGLIAD
jgi:hypothetical protein